MDKLKLQALLKEFGISNESELLGSEFLLEAPSANTLITGADSGIMFESGEPLTEAAVKLAENYQFLEKASLLNISEKADAAYQKIEREGQAPMYVVFEMPSGYSRMLTEDIGRGDKTPRKEARNRYWPGAVIHNFAEQIRKNKPVGYWGHAGMFDFNTVPDNIPIQWETAVKARRKSDNVDVTLARGYVYDNGMNRAYIETGATPNASVFTLGTHKEDTTDKGTRDYPVVVVESAVLLSFDLVRKGVHGIPGTRMVASSLQESTMGIEQIVALMREHGFTAEHIRKFFPDFVQELGSGSTPVETIELAKDYGKKCVELGQAREVAKAAESLAVKLGCTVHELDKTVSEALTARDTVITEIVNVKLSTVKSEAMRKQIANAMNGMKLNCVADVESAFNSAASAIRDAVVELAKENGVGHISGRMAAGDDDGEFLTSEAAQL